MEYPTSPTNHNTNQRFSSSPSPEHNDKNYISALSHEVKNQLTLMDSSLQLLLKKYPELSASPLWQQVCHDLQETFHVLKSASSFAGNRDLCLDSLNIKNFLEKTAHSFSPLMCEKGICFHTELDTCPSSAFIYADAIKLREVFTNLILNAVDALCSNASDTSAPNCSILLSAAPDNQNPALMNIHVKDNGPGIPEEYLATLFDPFITHKSNGTGLGLSIVKNIIEQHGGSVSVCTASTGDSPYTDFCVQLPFGCL